MKYKNYENLPKDTFERLDAYRDEILPDLKEFADLEETELGETTAFLIDLFRYTGYTSDEFAVALEKEIFRMYKMYHEEYEIIEHEAEEVQTYTYTTLEPKNP